MLVSELIENISRNYKGRGVERSPTEGTEKWNLYLDAANQQYRLLARKRNLNLSTFWELRSLGTTTSATTYNLPTDFIRPSDYSYILKNSQYYYFDTVFPERRAPYKYGQQVFISGKNPRLLTFNTSSLNTAYIGGTLYLAGYFLPTALSSGTDYVPDNIADWISYSASSELARNDPAKDDQYANLLSIANDLLEDIYSENLDIGYNQEDGVGINMPDMTAASDVWSDT